MSHDPPQEQFLFSFAESTLLSNTLKHTFGHLNCPACDAERDAIMYDPAELRTLRFPAAASRWLEFRKTKLKPRTWAGYEMHVEQLGRFFSDQVLKDIHIGHVKRYQDDRVANANSLWPEAANASYVNHQLCVLQMVLKHAGQMVDGRWHSEWDKIAPHYEALRTPAPLTPKVLSDVEEMMVFQVAASNPDWEVAYWAASITCNTGASGTELRHIQIKDLHLSERGAFFFVNPNTAKNHFRGRMVALNATAEKQLRRALVRAQSMGSTQPDHFLFPKRKGRNSWEPTKPASDSWLKRAFKELREATGISWLTPHCFRHQHITLRIEAGDPIEMVAKDVGHSATAMTRHYTHVRRERQQESMNKIDPSVRFGVQSSRPEPKVKTFSR